MKRFLYIFIVLLCSQVVWASKPIQIFVQLQAPHSPYLYEYANSGSHKMSVQIQVLDSRLMNHPVRVEMYVEKLGQGIVMKTNPAVNIPPKGYGASRNTTEYHNQAILRAMDAQERIHNLRINNDNIEYKIIKHGLFESALTPNSEGISEVAQQFVEWYVRHEFGMSASSPADTYFKIGKNEVVYQETLNTIDKIGLILMPLGLDIITDGIGAIYAGYYYDIETASYYGAGIVVAGVSGAVFRQLATRSKKISRVSGEFKIVDNVVHQSDDIASYMGKIPKELQKKLDALPDGGHKFSDDFAHAPDETLRKFIDNPELVEAWNILKNIELKTDIKWLEKVSNYRNLGLQLIEQGTEIMILQQSKEIARIADNILQIKIPYDNGWAKQSVTKLAIEASKNVETGVKLYRIGKLGQSHAAEAQFWSLENPLNIKNLKDFAKKYGIPEENLKGSDLFVEIGKLKSGSPFISREAPGFGNNIGGDIEIVVPAHGVQLETFHTIKF